MTFYPVNEFDPLMKGMLIGGIGILHVFVAQFAIGGGMLLCYFHWLAQTGREPSAGRFVDGYFRWLVLISFVIGALTGVGMWFTTIQVSPRTIGMMVDEFHWLWAIEWTFFCLEVVAGYVYYRYAARLDDGVRMHLLVLYSLAAWMSLFWINGILSWQLTPNEWTQSRSAWDGFFNSTFWPSLIYRTAASLTIAALVACIVINTMEDLDRRDRHRLIHRAAHLMLSIVMMPPVGMWFLAAMPADSRSWVQGGSVAMTLFINIAAAASVLIGGYAVMGLWWRKLYINGATATLLTALAFGATAGGEFVREGVRKPYTIRQTLYSNSIAPQEIARLREQGCTSGDPFPLRGAEQYPNDQVRLGALVYRTQCSVCHTLEGMNGLAHLTGSWTREQMRMNIAKLQYTKPFMPPFAGTPQELEALVQMINWAAAGRPREWPVSQDEQVLVRIRVWLDEAGTEPGDFQRYRRGQAAAGAGWITVMGSDDAIEPRWREGAGALAEGR